MGIRVLTAAMILGSLAHAAEPDVASGPWDLRALRQPPQVTWLAREGTLRSLLYANEPYRGKPTRVFAYYAVPEPRQGRAPAMVLVHGGGGQAYPDWAELWAKRGYAAIAMDLNGCGPKGEPLPDAMPALDHRFIFQSMSEGLRETWPYHAVAAVLRAISFLAAQPEVDSDRIGITGLSWGGFLTCMAASLDGRVKVAIPVYGCGFIYEDGLFVPDFQKMPDADRKLWIESFDPSRYLAQARVPMLWITGTTDIVYPLDIFQKSYRLPRGPRPLSVIVGMPHTLVAATTAAEIGLFADQHLRGGTPLAEMGPLSVQGETVEATFRSPVPVAKAALCYTTDTVIWKERKWETAPAKIAGDRLRAPLPAPRPIVFFLSLTDARGVTVTTEHRALGEKERPRE